MSFLRLAATRSSPSAIFGRNVTRAVRRTTSQPCLRIGQQSGRRGYASPAETIKKTSDLPWAATALVVTAVGTYIALSPTDGGAHAHDTHHEGQGKRVREDAEDKSDGEEAKEEPEAEAKEESSEQSEDKDDDKEEKESSEEEKPSEEDKSEDKSEDKDSKGDDSGEKSEDDTNASDDAGSKGDTQKGATKNKTDLKHREEDTGKGATKVRIDSPAGKKLGEGVSSGKGDAQAEKTQAGVSNTDTKHSEDPHADPGKSSKGEGTVDTAKIKGTVKPDRPQV